MCTGGEDKITKNEIFSKQFQFAWEHFKFHAEQRVRMFNFYILFLGLFGSAFALLVKDAEEPFVNYTFLVFYAIGIVSSIFLSLDIRNTQLVHQSEELLRKLEEDSLYCDSEWRKDLGDGPIKLGILSREAVLASFRKANYPTTSDTILRFIFVDNITHTFSIRIIEFLAMIFSWIFALVLIPDALNDKVVIFGNPIPWNSITWWGFSLSMVWSIWAMLRPRLDSSCEPHALVWFDKQLRR